MLNDDLLAFLEIIRDYGLDDPPVTITIIVVWAFGYGIAYIVFNRHHGKDGNMKQPRGYSIFCLLFGAGFLCIVFFLANIQIIGPELTFDEFYQRLPFTFGLGAILFLLIGAPIIYCRYREPAQSD